jgi:hypothetical protein
MSWLFGNFVHMVGPFYYWKTVLNGPLPSGLSGGAPPPAAALAADLRRSLLRLKGEHMAMDGARVDYDAMEKSAGFAEYKTVAAQLSRIDVSAMSEVERRAFFINVYNTLVVHALAYGFIRKSYWSIWGLSRKFLYSTASYNIGGHIYSLDEIEHGILRGNSPPVGAAAPLFLEADPRLPFVVQKDARIHFALNCGALSCPPISAYKADTLDSELSRASKSYLMSTAVIGKGAEAVVVLSKLFMWYKCDFGGTNSSVLEWARDNASHEISNRIRVAMESNPAHAIQYQEYLWDVNSV